MPPPGLVVLALASSALLLGLMSWRMFMLRILAVRRLRQRLEEMDGKSFVRGREGVLHWFDERKKSADDSALAEAWSEFDETLFIDDTRDEHVLRNSVRPSAFFNADDLHFGPGFYRILPGIFVSVGLSLTFLGLIAALAQMSNGAIDDAAMGRLLGIASAKFIMSLTGLICSIALTVALRVWIGRLDSELHSLCRWVEGAMQFASLEQIGMDQLAAMVEDREHHRQLTLQMIAEIGGPLKTELPAAISASIRVVSRMWWKFSGGDLRVV